MLDSCAWISIIKGEPEAARLDPLLDMIARGDAQLVESVLVLGEVYKKSTAPDRATREEEDVKLADIRTLLESRSVELVDVTTPVVRRATDLRAAHRMKLADAVHLASAQLNRCDWFLTLEETFPQAPPVRTFVRQDFAVRSLTLPWDLPGQDELPTLPDNVVSLRPYGR